MNYRMTLTASACAIALAAGLEMPAFAQETDAEAKLGTVTVTGSRIQRNEFELQVPVQTLTAEDLKISGANELSEALTELPAVFVGNSTENSQSSTQDSGNSTISLRALGDVRTLTLIDGRRTVTNSATGSVVSLSTIPDAFVERVEVITGGASAVYGSDAVSGVVNVITRDDYNGLSFGARIGTSDEGGNDEQSYQLLAGGDINEGRGNVMMALQYDDEGPLYGYQRDFASLALEVDQNLNGDPDEIVPNLSSTIPGGLFAGVGSNGNRDTSYWFYHDGTLTEDFRTDDDGYNDRPLTTISIPRERQLFAAKAKYDFTDWMQGFASVQYSHVYTKSERSPDTANSSKLQSDYPIYLADGVTPNPYVPQEIFDDAVALGRDSVYFSRRWTELGSRYREADNETLRTWAGVRGTVLSDWDYEAYVGYGEFHRSQSRVGDLVIPNYLAAIDIEEDPDRPGELRCVSELARAGGCVPLNVFGEGAVSQEAADWIILRDQLRARNKTTTAGFFTTGSPFELWAGDVEVAVGVEYRKDQTRTRWDPITTASQGTVTGQSNEDGQIDVTEGYAEFLVPLLKDAPFAKSLSVEGAIRVADYSTIGQTTSWKYGGSWAPVEDIRFRAIAARAERAPNTIELFSKGIGSQGGLSDPCGGVTATSVGLYDNACRQDPVVAAVIASDGILVDPGLQVQNPTFGNENLKQETADTLTLGAVFTPRFAPGLSVAVDYFSIKIEDAIGEITDATTLDFCYSDPDGFGANPACDLITRDTTTGSLVEVVQTSLNLNSLETEGVDIAASYSFQPKDIDWPVFRSIPGTVSMNLAHSYVMKLEEVVPSGVDTVATIDRLGLSGNDDDIGTPEHNTRFSVAWNEGPLSVSWRTVRIGETLNDDASRSRLEACRQYNNCGDKILLFIDPQWYHNLRVGYEFDFAKKTDVYFGINNLTNNTDPVLLGLDYNFSSTYDITGRYFYAGFTMDF